MNILAIDPGTQCGWAWSDGINRNSGVWNLKPTRWGDLGSRVLRLRNELRSVFALGVERVVYEEVRRHLGVDAAHVYGAIVGAIQGECQLAEIAACEAVPVGTIKKFATGKGNANKVAMLDAARARWPDVPIKDDNQADALWILAWAESGGLR